MRKVIVAFDGTHYSNGAFGLAKRLNESEKILLVGAFLPELDFSGLGYVFGGGGLYVPLQIEIDEDKVDENIQRFEDECVRNNIEFRVHKDHSPYAISKLQKESRFADLMILGSQKFYENLRLEVPSEYLRDILHDTECPVIVAPEKFDYPENVILAYDGTRSSVFAIKMFSYLFSDLCDCNTTLVYATLKHQPEMPDEDYMKELACRHFKDLTFLQLEQQEMPAFLEGISKPMLVTGAFGRSGLSNLFKRSFCTSYISEYRYPVFIAHK